MHGQVAALKEGNALASHAAGSRMSADQTAAVRNSRTAAALHFSWSSSWIVDYGEVSSDGLGTSVEHTVPAPGLNAGPRHPGGPCRPRSSFSADLADRRRDKRFAHIGPHAGVQLYMSLFISDGSLSLEQTAAHASSRGQQKMPDRRSSGDSASAISVKSHQPLGAPDKARAAARSLS